ncbi:TonB family protein [Olivibacter sp. SA151]|uniref:energy transducer TonB n=1 Tax=Olivibacter jilunii TaxID=985016 RepID=UPI003F18547E
MKILFILFTFLQTLALPSFAQLISRKDSADYIVKTYALADTIHVHGKLTTPDGEPAKGLLIWVQSKKYDYFDSPRAVTDSLGNYHIRYVEPGDTLRIQGIYLRQSVPVMGSRIINLTVGDGANLAMDTATIKPVGQKKQRSSFVQYKTKSSRWLQGSAGIPPKAADGGSGLQNYLKQHVIYPQDALDHGIEGLVSVTFEISKEGKPVNFRIRRGIGYGCEEAVIETIKNVAWRPSIQEGMPTNFEVEATLYFALE